MVRTDGQFFWAVVAIVCFLVSVYTWYLSLQSEPYVFEPMIWSGVAAVGFLASFYPVHRSDLLPVRVSPFIFSGGAMVFFLASFYLWYHSPFLTFGLLAGGLAVIALVHAYRTIGGIEWMIWLTPVIIELAFWPRLVIDALTGYSFPYPSYDLRALIYMLLFIAGFLLARRKYANHLRGQRSA
jgi:hypothetical protein